MTTEAEVLPAEEVEEEKKGRSKLVLIIIVVALVAVVGGGVWFFFLAPGDDAAATTTIPPIVEGESIEIGTMTVNLIRAEGEEMRYARFNFAVIVPMDQDTSIIGMKAPLLQDAALEVVSRYTAEDLLAPDGKTMLRDELTAKALEIFPDGEVIRVVLTQLIIQ